MPTNLSDFETRWTRMRLTRLDTPEGRAALADVVREYWEPLYHYVRRSGHSPDDAQDLTQGFVEHMLETKLIQKADPDKGSFRGLLSASLNNYVRKVHRKQSAQARGGDIEHVDLDFQTAETRYRAEIDPSLTPDEVLHQAWAESFRRHVDDEVAKYYARKNRLDRFHALLHFVFEPPGYGDYKAAGEPLQMSPNHVAVFVDRLAERWRRTARVEAGTMFGSLAEGDEEMRALGLGRMLDTARARGE